MKLSSLRATQPGNPERGNTPSSDADGSPMAAPGLLVSSMLGLAASASFLVVGIRLGARRPAQDAEEAHRGFRAWWFGTSVYAFLSGFVLNGLAFLDVTPVRLFVTIRTVSVITLCVAVWSLGHSVTFLVTGWRHARAAWAAGTAVTYLLVLWTFAGSTPTGVRVGAFDTMLVWTPAPEPALVAAVIALLTLPPTLAALAYFAVARRVEDPRARRRAYLVGASLTAWLLASLGAVAQVDNPLALARPLLGIVAGACVLAAYAPEARPTRSPAHHERAMALAARMRDLV